ncbi:MAG: hypothetical protein FWG13_06750 [Leptospirales bacterium]|nr:hypothetical protein [Leptospirales bacterium]
MLKRISFLPLFVFIAAALAGRDIDLDSIYIQNDSPVYKRLISQKADVYTKAGSQKIDGGVIFARWISGTGIVYIREFQHVNILYFYDHAKSSRRESIRIPGTVVAAVQDPEGRYLYIKHLVLNEDVDNENHFLTIDLKTGRTSSRIANNLFLDFSVPLHGSSLIFESRDGICEEFSETGLIRLLFPPSAYSSIVHNGNPTVAVFSPHRSRCLLLNGSGGSYKTMILGGGHAPADISSAQEIFWAGNDSIIYRAGYTGNYSVIVETMKKGRQTLVQQSLNTNLCFSHLSGKASFLHNQMIIIHNFNDKSTVNTGLEGEDVYFDPNGVFFVSLFNKNLYITRERTMLDRKSAITLNAADILQVYKQNMSNDKIMLNDYSKTYFQKKIQAYSSFLDIKNE